MLATTIVLIHGAWLNGASWDPWVERLRSQGYDVIAPSWPYLDHAPAALQTGVDARLADVGLREIIAHYEGVVAGLPERPILVGHSFGGRLAFDLAARAPRLVPKLVLLDPAILLPGHVALAAAENARIEKSYVSFDELVERRYEESQLHFAPRELVVEDLASHVETGEDGRVRYRYCQSAVVAAYGEMASAPPRFEDVRVPTLLVLGERSYLPYDHLLSAHRAALGDLLEVVVVPGGHSVTWDALEETSAAIVAFLGQPQSSAATPA